MQREFTLLVSCAVRSCGNQADNAVGADLQRDVSNAVTSVLNRLPGAYLFVLDAVVKHFRQYVVLKLRFDFATDILG
jgi:hypothetical protein